MHETEHEANACARLIEVANLVSVAGAKAEQATYSFRAAGFEAIALQLEAMREAHGVYATRVASLIRQVSGGAR